MPSRSLPKYALLLGALTFSSAAIAQVVSQGPGSPMCQRLEGQLASINSGVAGGDPARADQIRRYEDAAAKQQRELERVQAQAKRQGCDNSGFFSLFTGQSAQCGPVNNQIQQMRANLDQITGSLQQLRGGAGSNIDDAQRRSVLLALAQNNCGAQYANAARSGGFLDSLFGGGNSGAPDPNAPNTGTYRTVCARSCDGAYFPISFATVPGRFQDDERTCKSLCPNSEATLFTYRNPGEDIGQAVSLSGQPYSQSPNAFKFRTQFDKTCSCRAAGQSWADALKNVDDSNAAAQGDIIVTPENAKRMSQPAPTPASKRQAAPAAAPATSPAATDTSVPAGDKPIRSVGPTFIPSSPTPTRPN